jgi:hypothetical protein
MPWCIREKADWKEVSGSPKLHLRLYPFFIACPWAVAVSYRLSRPFPAEEEKSMKKLGIWNWISGISALALVFSVAPAALAQCGLPNKPIKPSAWQPQYGGASARLVTAAVEGFDEGEPSIVGMWHAVFTAQTMNGAPFSGVIDNSMVVWHSDGTEIMESARPPQDGNFCMGVWERTGRLHYFLNHIPWLGNDTTNAPDGIGNPAGGAQITEKITLSPDGKTYSGPFSLTAYYATGGVSASFTGMITATRVTVTTAFSSLL